VKLPNQTVLRALVRAAAQALKILTRKKKNRKRRKRKIRKTRKAKEKRKLKSKKKVNYTRWPMT
jgi:hypothetical protein